MRHDKFATNTTSTYAAICWAFDGQILNQQLSCIPHFIRISLTLRLHRVCVSYLQVFFVGVTLHMCYKYNYRFIVGLLAAQQMAARVLVVFAANVSCRNPIIVCPKSKQEKNQHVQCLLQEF